MSIAHPSTSDGHSVTHLPHRAELGDTKRGVQSSLGTSVAHAAAGAKTR